MKRNLIIGLGLLLLSACVKTEETGLLPLRYEVTASGAPKFVISHAGPGTDLNLKDTLELADGSTLTWQRDLEKRKEDFYFLRVSPVPQNALDVSIELAVYWDDILLDSTSTYLQKGLTLSGYLP